MQGTQLLQNFLWVGAGGFLGSVLRFGVSLGLRSVVPGWPWATLLVNVLGSFAIGFLAGTAEKYSPQTLLFLTVGILGGFTTFSTFSLETLDLFRLHSVGSAVGNVLANVCLGLAAVWLGRSFA